MFKGKETTDASRECPEDIENIQQSNTHLVREIYQNMGLRVWKLGCDLLPSFPTPNSDGRYRIGVAENALCRVTSKLNIETKISLKE